ncbi:related to ribonuclease III domain proteins [Phialocephala subalpina]|uniref:Large ribosomal subunit protein mL44 n=1 Tax=Phialocephala subalpina TaxID=576137 RepID=A0A1L7XP45_9HELO|nr:related to ribonuclease III domain proteins [Phialocephala subalpina]
MKRLRLERWSGQLLSPRTRPCCLRQVQIQRSLASQTRSQSSASTADIIHEDGEYEPVPIETSPPKLVPSTKHPRSQYASPPPSNALKSAKLAALHARLSLPSKVPLQTMARTLVDPSADSNANFNNASLAQLGGSIISYHVAEYLLCTYPRLPMTVLFAAAYAYNGPKTLQLIAKEWGVETAASPGSEVDPGLLQFSKVAPGTKLGEFGATTRPDSKQFYRRGISSRNVYDDEFGDTIPKDREEYEPLSQEQAYSSFVKAVVGSLFAHAGRDAAKRFVKQHILSRHLDISSLFVFKAPERELARLCKREEFEHPVARMLSETGRHSRSPVYVVGIYSGSDKLGEGAGPSLLEAKIRASVAALKAWYLYSPGNNVRLPSEMEAKGARPWEPVHIDLGEVIH